MQLDALNPLIGKALPDISDPFVARVYQGTAVFGRTGWRIWGARWRGDPKPSARLSAGANDWDNVDLVEVSL